jgi:hypothetical protein
VSSELSNELRFLVYALAVFQMSEMISFDYGPFDIFAMLRGKAIRLNLTLGKLLQCPLCLAVWFSIIAVILFVAHVVWLDYIVLVFALSGLSRLFSTFFKRNWSDE